MQDKLVSIITPLYNSERFVAKTIESVLAQTYPHWEMVVVDDGSKDNGPAIVASYAEADSRIRLYHQPIWDTHCQMLLCKVYFLQDSNQCFPKWNQDFLQSVDNIFRTTSRNLPES